MAAPAAASIRERQTGTDSLITTSLRLCACRGYVLLLCLSPSFSRGAYSPETDLQEFDPVPGALKAHPPESFWGRDAIDLRTQSPRYWCRRRGFRWLWSCPFPFTTGPQKAITHKIWQMTFSPLLPPEVSGLVSGMVQLSPNLNVKRVSYSGLFVTPVTKFKYFQSGLTFYHFSFGPVFWGYLKRSA